MKYMKRILLFFVLLLFFCFSLYDRYQPVSIDLVSPTSKEVEIKGEVYQPGVYTLQWEDTIEDLITMAGGLKEEADISSVSMVRNVQDKEVVVIPRKKDEEVLQISINSASVEELQQIPGVGPSIAQRIVEYRQMASFQALEDIMNVKGIGDKTYQKILPYICL